MSPNDLGYSDGPTMSMMMPDRSDDTPRPIKRRRRSAEISRPAEPTPSQVWNVYLANLHGPMPGRAWWLGRVMGRTEEIARRSAQKRWKRYANHPGLMIRSLDRPWPVHMVDHRPPPKAEAQRRGPPMP